MLFPQFWVNTHPHTHFYVLDINNTDIKNVHRYLYVVKILTIGTAGAICQVGLSEYKRDVTNLTYF